MYYGPEALREVLGKYNTPGEHNLLETRFDLSREAP